MGKGRRPRASAPEAIPCSISRREAGAGAASAGTGGTISPDRPTMGDRTEGAVPLEGPSPRGFWPCCNTAAPRVTRGSCLQGGILSPLREGCCLLGRDALVLAGTGDMGVWGAVNMQMQPLALPGVTRRCNPGRGEGRQHQTHGRGRTKGSFKGESGADSLQREILRELVFGEVFLVEHHRDPDWASPRRGCR